MGRVGRPRGLIAYDTIAKQEAAAKGATAPLQLLRPRTLLYAGLICLVGAIMLVALCNRTTLEINVLHDRNPPYVLLSDGSVRNGYTVKILNKLHSRASSPSRCTASPAPASPSSAWTPARRSASPPTICASSRSSSPCPQRRLPASRLAPVHSAWL